jgi:hypothetical protein
MFANGLINSEYSMFLESRAVGLEKQINHPHPPNDDPFRAASPPPKAVTTAT